MWPLRKNPRQRRLDVRKTRPQQEASVWRRFRDAGGPPALGLALAFYLAALGLDLWPTGRIPYRIGQYMPRDVHARVAFELPAPEVEPVQLPPRGPAPARFEIDTSVLDRIAEEMPALLAETVQPPAEGPEPGAAATTRPAGGENAPASQPADGATTRPAEDEGPATTRPALQTLAEMLGSDGVERYLAEVSTLRTRLGELLIVRPERLDDERIVEAPEMRFQRREGHDLVSAGPDALLPAGDAEALVPRLERLVEGFPAASRGLVLERLVATFVEEGHPLYTYDAEASARVAPVEVRPVRKDPERYHPGDRIARATRRDEEAVERNVPLSRSDWQRLRLEHEAYRQAILRERPWGEWARLAGRALVLLAATVAMCVYVARYEPSIVRQFRRGLAVAGVMVAMLAVAKLMDVWLNWNPHAAVLPVLMGSMVLAIAFDQRLALAAGGFLSVVLAMQLRGGVPLAMLFMAVAAVSVFQMRDVRSRSKLVEVAATAAIGGFAVVAAWGLIEQAPWRFILTDGLWAAGFALLAGFLIQGTLPVIERVFGAATSMTLLEWCDASKPLMRHLAMMAPGTYNHSLQLGAMCEAAAEAIGGRGLLARAGAYYHDIGKINKPNYFVENQAGSPSRHSKLSPAMSQLIITGHVKDGLEMARDYGLPKALHEFIATHHGTTLVQYFFQAAAEKSKREGDKRGPEETEFRYPGPRPRSKEAGILMLADASESSVRAMERPTPARIENQVHAMVTRRLMDGQLDDCALTLREVHIIEQSLVRSLCGIYHARIAYPTPAGEKPSPAEQNRAADRKSQAAPAEVGSRPPAEAAKSEGPARRAHALAPDPEDSEQVAES